MRLESVFVLCKGNFGVYGEERDTLYVAGEATLSVRVYLIACYCATAMLTHTLQALFTCDSQARLTNEIHIVQQCIVKNSEH